MRKLAVLAFVGLVVAHVSVTAQGRPDFAGVWTLIPELTSPADAKPLGPQVRIEQTATSLTIASPAMLLRTSLSLDRSAVASSVTPSSDLTVMIYELDGLTHGRPVPANRPTSTVRTESASYRATWAEAQLVITTSEALRITEDPLQPVAMERVVRQILSLDGNGRLVMDTLISVAPSGRALNPPVPIPMRAVYRKTQ